MADGRGNNQDTKTEYSGDTMACNSGNRKDTMTNYRETVETDQYITQREGGEGKQKLCMKSISHDSNKDLHKLFNQLIQCNCSKPEAM